MSWIYIRDILLEFFILGKFLFFYLLICLLFFRELELFFELIAHPLILILFILFHCIHYFLILILLFKRIHNFLILILLFNRIHNFLILFILFKRILRVFRFFNHFVLLILPNLLKLFFTKILPGITLIHWFFTLTFINQFLILHLFFIVIFQQLFHRYRLRFFPRIR